MAVSKDFKIKIIVTNQSDKAFDNLSDGAKKAVEDIQTLEPTLKAVEDHLVSINESVKDSSSGIAKMGAAFQIAETTISNFQRAIGVLTDQAQFDRMQKFLRLLEFMARLTGNANLAKGVSALSRELTNGFIKVNEVVGDTTEKFKDMERSINAAGLALEIYDGLAQGVKVTLAGLTLSGLILGLRNVSDSTKDVKAATTAFSVFSESLRNGSMLSERSLLLLKGQVQSLGPAILNLTKTFGSGFVQGFMSPLKAMADGFNLVQKESGLLGRSLGNALTPGLLGVVEKATKLSGVLFALGQVVADSENAFAKWGGRLLIVAAILTGGFAAATIFILHKIAELSIAIGDKLLNAMAEFEKIAQKGELATKQFAFTLQGFAREIGVGAVGSLEEWNEVIESVVDATTFGGDEVRKAVALLVKESQVTGLSLNQNIKLLDSAVEIAASTGKTIEEVTLALAKGITGNTQATIALGIALTDSALAHTDYVENLNKEVSALSDVEKQQARYHKIIKSTKPLIGSAALELQTITGANKEYEQSLIAVQAALGASGTFTQKYLVLLTDLNRAFVELPDSLIQVIGGLQDFLGVTLKITGTVLSYIFLLAGLRTAYLFLNVAVGSSVILQAALTKVFAFTAKVAGVQTVAVTSLGAVYTNLVLIIKGLVVSTFQSLGAVVVSTTKLILVQTAKILTSPLFLKAALVVVVVSALAKAYKQVTDQLKALTKATEVINKETGKSVNLFEELGKIVNGSFKIIVDVATLAIVGIMQLVQFVKIAVIGLRQLKAVAFGNKQEFEALRLEAVPLLENLDNLAQVATTSKDRLAGLFSNTAMAAELVTEQIQKATESVRGFSKSLRSISTEALENLSVEALGSDADRLLARFQGANKALNAARNIGILEEGKLRAASADELLKLEGDRERARVDILKFRQDFLEDLAKRERGAAIDALKDSGKVIEAIKLKSSIERAEFAAQIKDLKQTGKLTKEQLDLITKTEKAMKASEAAQISKERQKQLEDENKKLEAQQKLIQDLNTALKGVQRANLETVGDQKALAAFNLAANLQELDVLEKRLLTQKEFLDDTGKLKKEYAEILRIAREVAQQDFEDAVPLNLGDIFDALRPENIKKFFGNAFAGVKNIFDNGIGKSLLEGISKGSDHLLESLRGVAVSDIGNGIMAAFEAGAKLVKVLLSGEFLKIFSDIGQFFLDIPKMLTEAAEQFVKVFDDLIKNIDSVVADMVSGFDKALTALVDRLPDILGKVVPKLIEGIGEVLTKLAEKLPAIFSAFFEAAPKIIESIFLALPKVVDAIIRAVPGIIEAFAKNIGPFVEAFISGFIGAAGEIVASLIDSLLIEGGLERIVKALIEAMPRIAAALVMGIVKGLQRALGAIGSAIFGKFKTPASITNLPAKISEAAKKLGEDLATGASKIFAVKDLEAAAKGFGIETPDILGNLDEIIALAFKAFDLLDYFLKAIQGAFKKLYTWFVTFLEKVWKEVLTKILRPLAKLLEDAWRLVWDKLLQPLGELLVKAWLFMIENILQPLGNLIANAFKWAFTQIIEPIGNLIKNAFQLAIDNIFAPLAAILTEAWQIAVARIIEPLKNAFVTAVTGIAESLTEVLTGIFSTSLSQAINALLDVFTKFFTAVFKATAGFLAKPFDGISKIMQTLAKALTDVTAPFNKLSEVFGGIGRAFETFANALSPITDVFRALIDALGKFSIPGIGGGGGGGGIGVKGSIGGKKFSFSAGGPVTQAMALASGGMIEAIRAQNGVFVDMSPVGVDTVPAMLAPGEFVVSRKGVQAVGPSFLRQVNAGVDPSGFGGGSSFTMGDIVINAKTNLDASSIQREVVPVIERELKRKSQDGQFILSKNGIR